MAANSTTELPFRISGERKEDAELLRKGHDFNFCPVNESTTHAVNLHNTHQKRAFEFELLADAPFSVSPQYGVLQPNTAAPIMIAYSPSELTTHIGTVVMRYWRQGTDRKQAPTLKFRLSGIGKSAMLEMSPAQLDFGDVLTGQTVTKTVILQNRSFVSCRWGLLKSDVDLEEVFSLSPKHGVLPSQSNVEVKITYAPTRVGTYSCDRFSIGGPSASTQLTFVCTGMAAEPQISLSTNCVNFGFIEVGKKATQTFSIVNQSRVETDFQFMGVQPGAAFCLDKTHGHVGSADKVHAGTTVIKVTFKPTHAIHYHRRLQVLVQNQTFPMFIDIVGSARDSRSGDGPLPLAANALPAPPTSTALWRAVFAAPTSVTAPFSVDNGEMNFGYAQRVGGEGGGHPRVLTLNVRNNTAYAARAAWETPRSDGDVKQFDVHPATADLTPFSNHTFTVTFRPQHANTYYYQMLECYVSRVFKIQRRRRKSDDSSSMDTHEDANDENKDESEEVPVVMYPDCLCVSVMGHTFSSHEQFATDAGIDRRSVVFPPCHTQDSVYQLLRVHNKGATPLHYEVTVNEAKKQIDEDAYPGEEQDDELPSFHCCPRSSLVPPHSTGVIALRFSPGSLDERRATAVVRLNSLDRNALQVPLVGKAHQVELKLPDHGTLQFRKTAVHTASSSTCTITNTSRVALTFRWTMSNDRVFTVEPQQGLLRGNESTEIKFTFKPKEKKRYVIQYPCEYTPVAAPTESTAVTKRTFLTLVGEGSTGYITMEPAAVDFDGVLLGTPVEKTITLHNTSDCAVAFEMGYTLTPNANKDDPIDDNGSLLKFSPASGSIPGRTHVVVSVQFKPTQRRAVDLTAFCRMLDGNPRSAGTGQRTANGRPTSQTGGRGAPVDLAVLPQCRMTGAGVLPILYVSDVRSMRQRKSHLLDQFSITALNDFLREEVMGSNANDFEFSVKRQIAVAPSFTFDFGAGPVQSFPTSIFIQLTNPGKITADFAFKFPNETDLERERWYHEEELDDQDSAYEKILDANLYQIEPKSGSIKPGESACIQFVYQHTMREGSPHVLPVLFTVKHSKRTTLVFTGRTVDLEEPYLHFVHPSHTLASVAVGDGDAPMQYYELRNPSNAPAKFYIDMEPIEKLNAANFNFPIITLFTPEGEVSPQDSGWLRVLFRPLEVKEYSVDITVTMAMPFGGQKQYPLRLSGWGHHPDQLTEEDVQTIAEAEFTRITEKPTLRVPVLPLQLSLDALRFGRVPAHAVMQRMVVLNNNSTYEYTFAWVTSLPGGPDGVIGTDCRITVTPNGGEVPPGGRVVCQFTVDAGSISQIIDQDVECLVYNRGLQDTLETMRETHGNGTDKSGRSGGYAGAAGAAIARSRRPRNPVTQLPEKFQNESHWRREMIRAARQGRQMEEQIADDLNTAAFNNKPVLLPLRLQMRVMNTSQYAAKHASELGRQFQPALQAPIWQINHDNDEGKEIESDVMGGLLSDMIREVINTAEVALAFERMPTVRVPTYAQRVGYPLTVGEEGVVDLSDTPAGQKLSGGEGLVMQNGEFQSAVQALLRDINFEVSRDLLMAAGTGFDN